MPPNGQRGVTIAVFIAISAMVVALLGTTHRHGPVPDAISDFPLIKSRR